MNESKRKCTLCGERKTPEAFSVADRRTSPYGPRDHCDDCLEDRRRKLRDLLGMP